MACGDASLPSFLVTALGALDDKYVKIIDDAVFMCSMREYLIQDMLIDTYREAAAAAALGGVVCLIPPNSTPTSVNKFVAPYMTQAAMDEVVWWTAGWWRTGDDVWWMARLEGDKALELNRMDQRLRPTMSEPMCVPEQHVRFINAGRDGRGILFQALDCRKSPVACM